MPVTIRAARSEDGPALQSIEVLAGRRFREVGLAAVAEDDPPSLDAFARGAADATAWVAVDQADTPIGYVMVDVVDGNAHIEQLSVTPRHQGAGVGRALVDTVRAWASNSGRAALTLTTFAEVPWNAPLYRHLGFRVLGDAEIGPELRDLRDEEAAHGLDPALRVCMRSDVAASS
jgi:ribosomal protein S18 acetylase RimI-like enzyme